MAMSYSLRKFTCFSAIPWNSVFSATATHASHEKKTGLFAAPGTFCGAAFAPETLLNGKARRNLVIRMHLPGMYKTPVNNGITRYKLSTSTGFHAGVLNHQQNDSNIWRELISFTPWESKSQVQVKWSRDWYLQNLWDEKIQLFSSTKSKEIQKQSSYQIEIYEKMIWNDAFRTKITEKNTNKRMYRQKQKQNTGFPLAILYQGEISHHQGAS